MGAVKKHFPVTTYVQRIKEAEVDMALICHDEDKMETAIDILHQDIQGASKTREKTMEFVKRILKLKSHYAIS